MDSYIKAVEALWQAHVNNIAKLRRDVLSGHLTEESYNNQEKNSLHTYQMHKKLLFDGLDRCKSKQIGKKNSKNVTYLSDDINDAPLFPNAVKGKQSYHTSNSYTDDGTETSLESSSQDECHSVSSDSICTKETGKHSTVTYICQHYSCQKSFASKISLANHMRTHRMHKESTEAPSNVVSDRSTIEVLSSSSNGTIGSTESVTDSNYNDDDSGSDQIAYDNIRKKQTKGAARRIQYSLAFKLQVIAEYDKIVEEGNVSNVQERVSLIMDVNQSLVSKWVKAREQILGMRCDSDHVVIRNRKKRSISQVINDSNSDCEAFSKYPQPMQSPSSLFMLADLVTQPDGQVAESTEHPDYLYSSPLMKFKKQATINRHILLDGILQ